MQSNAEIVLKGNVIDSITLIEENVVSTKVTVRVEKQWKGLTQGDTFTFRMSGGIIRYEDYIEIFGKAEKEGAEKQPSPNPKALYSLEYGKNTPPNIGQSVYVMARKVMLADSEPAYMPINGTDGLFVALDGQVELRNDDIDFSVTAAEIEHGQL